MIPGLVLRAATTFGLVIPSRAQLRETIESRGVRCGSQELQEALDGLPGLQQWGERELRWSQEALHRATLQLVSEDPAWFLHQAATLQAWQFDRVRRLAVYLNRFEMLPETAPEGPWAQPFLLPHWDDAFFESRVPALQQILLVSLRTGLWKHGVWSHALQHALDGCRGADEMRLEAAMARGELDRAKTLLTGATRRKGYDAVLMFLEGDAAGAHARFTRLIANRKSPLESYVCVFARLAAVRVNALEALVDPRLVVGGMPELERFFGQLAAFLRGKGPSPTLPSGNGLEWCVAWALRSCLADAPAMRFEALERLTASGLHGWLACQSWGAEVVRKEPWRIWLDELRGKAATAPVPVVKPVAPRRLAWRIANRALSAVVMTSDGPGTELSLAALLDSPPDYLTDLDHRVLAQVDRQQWGRTIHLMGVSRAVRALIGHPGVLYEDRPVRLVEGRQRLSVERAESGFRVMLKPRLRDEADWALRRVSPSRGTEGGETQRGADVLEVCFPSPHNEALAPLLDEAYAVPFEAEDALREALSPWLDHIELTFGEGVRPFAEPTAGGELVARLRPAALGLRMFWVWRVPGGPTLSAFRGPVREVVRWNGRVFQVERNFEAERERLESYRELSPALPDEEEGYFETLDDALELLGWLREARVPTEWPESGAWNVRATPHLRQLSVRADSDRDWFHVRGQLRLDNGLAIELKRLLELTREHPGRYLRLDDGDYLELGEELRQRLRGLDDVLEDYADSLRISPLAAPALAELAPDLEADVLFREACERFEAAASHAPDAPATLQAELRDYQLEGYRWLSQRARAGAGACLADDMGLGKTMQVLALFLELQESGAHLVVCPVSVTAHWRDQIERFAPGLRPLLYEGRERALLAESLGPGDVLIYSYRILLQDIDQLRELRWNVALLDEAQNIKNPLAQTAAAAFALQAAMRVATTGTPVENRVSELWSIFRFLNPGLLGGLTNFRRRFEGRNRASQRRLRALVAPFLLRRTKAQVLTELPPRTEISLVVELSPEERALYELERRAAREDIESPGGTFQTLAWLTRLRQACCHPRLLLDQSDLTSSKLVAFFELLEDLQAGRHRCLVFSQFTSLLDLLEVELKRREVSFQRLDGTTPVAERRRRVDAFQRGEGDLFLISLKAGGTGLNLTAADFVVHLDPWWNPAAEDQASDRAHRIGQTRPVTVYRFVARDTVEEKVLQLHGHKRQLALDLLDGREQAQPLTAEEIRRLLIDDAG